MRTLRIFIGYDPKETVAFHTLAESILDKSSIPVSITPLNLKNLGGIYRRNYDTRQSNEFSFSRFLVPYLCEYEGNALFMDCDMLLTADIAELLEVVERSKPVSVVKHDYTSAVTVKYLGNKQYNYPRKNWSSFIFWNCGHVKNKVLTPEYIAEADAATLHRFLWLDDNEVGEIPRDWNWLVGEYETPTPDLKVLHWTLGGPYFHEYNNVYGADKWHYYLDKINFCQQSKK